MISVITSGFQSTVQDIGRFGYSHLGISISGAADSISYSLGNLIVGNKSNEAAIEMTLTGGEFLFECDSIISITGADFQPTIENKIVQMWQTLKIKKGEILKFGSTLNGARCYLCVKGGIDVKKILGSSSTHLLTGLGGFEGRSLKQGDKLSLIHSSDDENVFYRLSKDIIHKLSSREILRVTSAPQTNYFSEETINRFASEKFLVTEESNRMGLRLSGSKLNREIEGDIITEGVALGSIQVSHDGQPIILFVEHQTTGGYPKIANVISADLYKVGQLRPRDEIKFQFVTLDEAYKLRLELESLISFKSFEIL